MLRPNPQPACAILVKRGDPFALESSGIAGREHRDPDAIEADQPAERAQPEIAVTGLDDRRDRVLRQALLSRPDRLDVLVGTLVISLTQSRSALLESRRETGQYHQRHDQQLWKCVFVIHAQPISWPQCVSRPIVWPVSVHVKQQSS
jgi:hypothetical protein